MTNPAINEIFNSSRYRELSLELPCYKAIHAAFNEVEQEIDQLSKEELLNILDRVANNYRGQGVDFDDDERTPLGRALVKMFSPTLKGYPDQGTEQEQVAWDERWCEEVETPFYQRYGFYQEI
jgi:hypothetical protein